jgi:hypothetical protein
MYMLVQRKGQYCPEFRSRQVQSRGMWYIRKLIENHDCVTSRKAEGHLHELWQSVWGPQRPESLATEFRISAARVFGAGRRASRIPLATIMDDGDLPYKGASVGFPKGGATSGARGRFTGVHGRDWHQLPRSASLPVQLLRRVSRSNGVTYRHKYYLARLWTHAAYQSGNDHGIPG